MSPARPEARPTQVGGSRERLSFARGKIGAAPAFGRQDGEAGGRTEKPAPGMGMRKGAER